MSAAIVETVTRIAALTALAAIYEFALPSGKLRNSGRRAMGLIVLLGTVQCILSLAGSNT